MCMSGANESHKSALDSLELELQVAMSPHVGAENLTQQPVLLTAKSSFQPHFSCVSVDSKLRNFSRVRV